MPYPIFYSLYLCFALFVLFTGIYFFLLYFFN